MLPFWILEFGFLKGLSDLIPLLFRVEVDLKIKSTRPGKGKIPQKCDFDAENALLSPKTNPLSSIFIQKIKQLAWSDPPQTLWKVKEKLGTQILRHDKRARDYGDKLEKNSLLRLPDTVLLTHAGSNVFIQFFPE